MKRYLIIAFSVVCISAYGQKRTIKYCEIHVRERGLSRNNISVEVVPGKVDSLSFFSDKTKMYKISRLITRTDVLNFMSAEGWTLSFITSNGDESDQRLIFSKEFFNTVVAKKTE